MQIAAANARAAARLPLSTLLPFSSGNDGFLSIVLHAVGVFSLPTVLFVFGEGVRSRGNEPAWGKYVTASLSPLISPIAPFRTFYRSFVRNVSSEPVRNAQFSLQ